MRRGVFYILIALMALSVLSVSAQRFHCDSDTAKAMAIVRKNQNPNALPGARAVAIAEALVGEAYEDVTAKDVDCVPELRIDGMDNHTFINNVVAMVRLTGLSSPIRLKDLVESIENVSYRNGRADGFTSKMIYGGDWVVDNRARGNLKELTEDYSEYFKTKVLDGITANREKYAALSDSATFEKQKFVEMGFRLHKIPHLKRETVGKKDIEEEMRNGDVVMLLSPDANFDVFETGIVVKRDDGFHLIHASKRDGRVVEEKDPLLRYVKRHQKEIYGWRWFRLL